MSGVRLKSSRFIYTVLFVAATLVAGLVTTSKASAASNIRIVTVPQGTSVADLDRKLDGAAIGLLNSAIGVVSAKQAYLDASQGNRVPPVLYDEPLPPFTPVPGEPVPAAEWRMVVERADRTPAPLIPGLLATTLINGDITVGADEAAGNTSLMLVTENGVIPSIEQAREKCANCPSLTLELNWLNNLAAIQAEAENAGDLLIVIERFRLDRRLRSIAFVGEGFEDGTLTSSTTRTAGIVALTDLGPTLIKHFGLDVPDEMIGREITHVPAGQGPDVAGLASMKDRFEIKSGRRGKVVEFTLIAWIAIAAAIAFGYRRSRPEVVKVAAATLALAVLALPASTVLIGSLRPPLAAEWAIVAIATPAVAYALQRLVGGWIALAIVSLGSVLLLAVDMVAGTGLVINSVIGSSPAAGSRFFGIGNEFEIAVACLLPIGLGALMAATRSLRHGGWWAAAVFVAVIFAFIPPFALGSYGADVGAAIVMPAAALIAAAVAARSKILVVVAVVAPIAGVAGLLLADLVLGIQSHLVTGLIDIDSPSGVFNLLERRLVQTFESFGKQSNLIALPFVIALAVAAAMNWRQVAGWFGNRVAVAGWIGAVAATLVGTVANDSGALLLVYGTVFCAAAALYAWANRESAGD